MGAALPGCCEQVSKYTQQVSPSTHFLTVYYLFICYTEHASQAPQILITTYMKGDKRFHATTVIITGSVQLHSTHTFYPAPVDYYITVITRYTLNQQYLMILSFGTGAALYSFIFIYSS